jgi:hypothetical protein
MKPPIENHVTSNKKHNSIFASPNEFMVIRTCFVGEKYATRKVDSKVSCADMATKYPTTAMNFLPFICFKKISPQKSHQVKSRRRKLSSPRCTICHTLINSLYQKNPKIAARVIATVMLRAKQAMADHSYLSILTTSVSFSCHFRQGYK